MNDARDTNPGQDDSDWPPEKPSRADSCGELWIQNMSRGDGTFYRFQNQCGDRQCEKCFPGWVSGHRDHGETLWSQDVWCWNGNQEPTAMRRACSRASRAGAGRFLINTGNTRHIFFSVRIKGMTQLEKLAALELLEKLLRAKIERTRWSGSWHRVRAKPKGYFIGVSTREEVLDMAQAETEKTIHARWGKSDDPDGRLQIPTEDVPEAVRLAKRDFDLARAKIRRTGL